MKKILIVLFIVGLFAFNLSFDRNKDNAETLTLQNIEILQANASEATCDSSSSTKCEIRSSDGTIGTGTGTLIVKL